MLSREVLLEGPRAFVHGTRVRFADSVGGGALFFPKMLELFHDAYEGLLEAHGIGLPQVLSGRLWGAPLVHADVEFLRDLPTFGTPIDIVIAAGELGGSRVSFGYRAHDRADGALLAIGTTVHAFVDLSTFKKADVPESVCAMMRSAFKLS
jgi:acyl-CoA thioesterase FadM